MGLNTADQYASALSEFKENYGHLSGEAKAQAWAEFATQRGVTSEQLLRNGAIDMRVSIASFGLGRTIGNMRHGMSVGRQVVMTSLEAGTDGLVGIGAASLKAELDGRDLTFEEVANEVVFSAGLTGAGEVSAYVQNKGGGAVPRHGQDAPKTPNETLTRASAEPGDTAQNNQVEPARRTAKRPDAQMAAENNIAENTSPAQEHSGSAEPTTRHKGILDQFLGRDDVQEITAKQAAEDLGYGRHAENLEGKAYRTADKLSDGREIRYTFWDQKAWTDLQAEMSGTRNTRQHTGGYANRERGSIDLPIDPELSARHQAKTLFEEQMHIALGTGDTLTRGGGDNEYFTKLYREGKMPEVGQKPLTAEEIMGEVVSPCPSFEAPWTRRLLQDHRPGEI